MTQRRVIHFQYSIEVCATPETVWDVAEGPEWRPRWDTRVAKYIVDSGVPTVGAAVEIRFRAPLAPVARGHLVRFDPPHQSALRIDQMTPAFLPTGGGTWIFTPLAGGRTRMTTRFALYPPAGTGFLGWLCCQLFCLDTVRAMRRLRRLLGGTQFPSSPTLQRAAR